jgi:hypothetical protein
VLLILIITHNINLNKAIIYKKNININKDHLKSNYQIMNKIMDNKINMHFQNKVQAKEI